MKRIIVFLTGLVMAMFFACNLDNTVQLAGTDSGTKAQNPSDAWQQTIDQADEVIKGILVNHYTKCILQGRTNFYSTPINVEARGELDVFGFPVYTIDSALWASSPALPLDSYLRIDDQTAVFYVFSHEKTVAKIAAIYNGNTWEMTEIIGGAGTEHTQNALQARDAGERIISINPAPKRGNAYLIYVYRDNEWVRIDDGRKRSTDPVEDLRLGWNHKILNLPPYKPQPGDTFDLM